MTRKHVWGLGVLVLSYYLAAGVLAQGDEEQLGVPTELDKAYKSGGLNLSFQASPLTKNDQAALEKAAQYLVWRVTWLDVVSHQDKLAQVIKEFDREYQSRTGGKADKKAVEYFNARMVDSFKAVFERKFESNRVSTINAAQMLPLMAKGKSAELGKYLVEVVKDPKKHDAIKLYAVKALQEYNAIRPFPVTNEVRKVDVMTPDVERVTALIDFIERKPPEDASPAQLEAFAYVRREAVRSLAQYQVPAVIADKAKVEGVIAVTLMKVLSKNPNFQFTPEPGIAEKCEAVLGLASMRINEVPEYQPQIGVFVVGRTVAEFVDAYRADYTNFNDKKKIAQIAWGNYGDRMKQALAAQATNTKDSAGAAAMSADLYKSSAPILDSIKGLKQVENPLAIDFRKSLNKHQNPGKSPFKTNKKIEVDHGWQ